MNEAHQAAAFAARTSYGRLLAVLARRTNDLAGAEDALASAFAQALTSWPTQGVPANPDGWLLTVARRRLFDASKHAAIRQRPAVQAALASDELTEQSLTQGVDDQLRLMLVCTHPAIDQQIRPALILQTVLGLSVNAMASAFLVSPETLNKRLVRAKAKLRVAGIGFTHPSPEELPERLLTLLEAIYAAFLLGGEGAVVDGDTSDELRLESVYLANLVAQALPREPEALGFLALVLFVEARRPAQLDAQGEFVPLLEQDHSRWHLPLLNRAYRLLEQARREGAPGPFQLEAAIQAAHCYRARSGVVPWREIAALYAKLVEQHETIGAAVGHSVALGEAVGSARGLEALRAIDPSRVRGYQPWWVAASHLLQKAGDPVEARRCLEQAIELTTHPRLRRFLDAKLAAWGS